MDTSINPKKLLSGARLWQQIVVVLGLIDGAAFIFTPGLTDSGAYSWARQFLPGWGWGTLFACSSLLGLLALIGEGRGKWWPVLLSRLSLTIYGLAAGSIGLSIAILTFQGAVGAITGASKWWLPFFLSARVLAGQTMIAPWSGPPPVDPLVSPVDPYAAGLGNDGEIGRSNNQ